MIGEGPHDPGHMETITFSKYVDSVVFDSFQVDRPWTEQL
jgi:hypothetical protein